MGDGADSGPFFAAAALGSAVLGVLISVGQAIWTAIASSALTAVIVGGTGYFIKKAIDGKTASREEHFRRVLVAGADPALDYVNQNRGSSIDYWTVVWNAATQSEPPPLLPQTEAVRNLLGHDRDLAERVKTWENARLKAREEIHAFLGKIADREQPPGLEFTRDSQVGRGYVHSLRYGAALARSVIRGEAAKDASDNSTRSDGAHLAAWNGVIIAAGTQAQASKVAAILRSGPKSQGILPVEIERLDRVRGHLRESHDELRIYLERLTVRRHLRGRCDNCP